MSQYEISLKFEKPGEKWFGYAKRTGPGGEHLIVKRYAEFERENAFSLSYAFKIMGPFTAKDEDEAKKIYTNLVVDKYYTIK
jgi:hypothetical protein